MKAKDFFEKRLWADDEYDFDKVRLKDFIVVEMEAYAEQQIKELKEGLEATLYALENHNSNQQFAINVGKQALKK